MQGVKLRRELIEKLEQFRDNAYINDSDYDKLDHMIDVVKDIQISKEVIEFNLTQGQMITLIECFGEWYNNTNQEASLFAEEHYYVVNDIVNGLIPIKLNYLNDYLELLIEAVPELKKPIGDALKDI